ncbi:TetR family transcriptional regulator [Streptomyces mirabilis]|uniref:TetR/AcrR family transcriptional regulator n=1 Tax=Streptomyces mirabilis TaxID=68239 RepID=UPI00367E7122
MAQPSMRDAIRKAGREEFHERGYYATGIAAITARADAHKGSFYNHYASKEDLAVEVITDYGNEQRMEMLEDASVEPLTRIEQHFTFVSEALRAFDFRLGCMLGNFSAEITAETPRIQETLTANLDYWAGLLTKALDEAAKAHAAVGHDSETTAWLLIDGYEGAALRGRATRSARPMNAFLSTGMPQTLAAFRSHYTK